MYMSMQQSYNRNYALKVSLPSSGFNRKGKPHIKDIDYEFCDLISRNIIPESEDVPLLLGTEANKTL